MLYCASADRTISVVSSGKLEGQLTNAHDEAINKILHLENNYLIGTGDDNGVVKIWDLRVAT